MKLIEDLGLIKFDQLGLSTLTTIRRAVEYIKENHGIRDLDVNNIRFDDPLVFDTLCKGDLAGLFQLSGSTGFRDVTIQIQPRHILHVADITSLYRPGPLDNGFVEAYIKNKNTDKITSQINIGNKEINDRIQELLSQTYGVIIYQETVMKIAQIMAGFSLGAADLLRKAMGKKDAEKMNQQRKAFIDGCLANKIAEEDAYSVFDILAKFAEYGFCKSHAVSYSIITYQTAWLKTYYPTEFYAAALTEVMLKDTDSMIPLVNAVHEAGIKLRTPDVNESIFEFKPVKGKKEIVFGFGGLNGLGETVVNELLKTREEHKFINFFDFCYRVPNKVNRKSIEVLIKSGAMDSIL